MHNPIQICELSLQLGTKLCFDNFSYTIYSGEKIAIIGDNGSGKSGLLKLIANLKESPIDEITRDNNLVYGYVPQIINSFTKLSGGQRFNKVLSQVMSNHPDILLLDEPSNHLDENNRKSLFQLIKNHPATQVIISHDVELLDACIDTLWHIHDGRVTIFKGKYSSYLTQLARERKKLLSEINQLKQAQKNQHEALMQEQLRAKNSRKQGEKHIKQRKWPTITSGTKARRAETTAGKNKANLNTAKDKISSQLGGLWEAEEISYSFNLCPSQTNKVVVTISDGSFGYLGSGMLLSKVNLNICAGEKVAIKGANGSGKSTLVKAIMQDTNIWLSGEWSVPNLTCIAYLDQHYTNLPAKQTIIEYIKSLQPTLSNAEVRTFLNQFLFRKNEEVNKVINILSGGEKVRLSLAAIALQKPKLLVLDEVTNNIDLNTKQHIIQVLRSYSGAMLIISHDKSFLELIQITRSYNIS